MKLSCMLFVIFWGAVGAAKGEFVISEDPPASISSKKKYSDAEVIQFLDHLKSVNLDLYKALNAKWKKELSQRKKTSHFNIKKQEVKDSQRSRNPASQTTKVDTH